MYRLPELEEIAAALAAQGIADPAGLLQCGAPAYAFARRHSGALTVIPELPLFTIPGIGDTRPADVTRRQVLSEALAGDRAAFQQWSALYAQAAPLLGPENSYRSALESHQRSAPALLEATAVWLATDARLERPATVAEAIDCREVAPYLRLFHLGVLRQALEAAADCGPPSPGCLALLEQVTTHLEVALADVLPSLRVVPVPIGVLVEIVQEIVVLALRVGCWS